MTESIFDLHCNSQGQPNNHIYSVQLLDRQTGVKEYSHPLLLFEKTCKENIHGFVAYCINSDRYMHISRGRASVLRVAQAFPCIVNARPVAEFIILPKLADPVPESSPHSPEISWLPFQVRLKQGLCSSIMPRRTSSLHRMQSFNRESASHHLHDPSLCSPALFGRNIRFLEEICASFSAGTLPSSRM